MIDAILLDSDTTPAHLFNGGASATGVAIQSAAGRSGGNSLRITVQASEATQNIGSNVGSLNVAFGWNPSALASPGAAGVLQFLDAGTCQIEIKVLADGTVQALRGSGGTLLGASSPGAIAAGAYQHVEVSVTISATVGTVDVWVNTTNHVLSLTGQNTKNTANSTVSGFEILGPWTATHDFCDIIWKDSRINDRRVECFVPTGAGSHTDWTPSTGANWQNVDEVPPNDDTDFNSSTTVGNIDSFAHGALTAAPLSIDAVIVQVRARNTTTGSGSVAPFLRSVTTDSPGTGVGLNTTYQDIAHGVYTTDPATSAAWANAAAVNAAEIGYKKTV